MSRHRRQTVLRSYQTKERFNNVLLGAEEWFLH